MNGLFENPLPILFAGVVVFAIVFAIWTQQKTRGWMAAVVATAFLTLAGLFLERIVVTDVETVETTIHQVATDMESNNIAALTRHISEDASHLRKYAESILSRVKVETVSVKRNLTVTIVDHGTRKTAIAKFNAVARIEDKSGAFGHQTIPRFMILNLVQEGSQWRVTGYEDRMPQEGIGR
jgi:hypothetical protein